MAPGPVGNPQQPAVGVGGSLQVDAVIAVFAGAVGLVRGDPVDPDDGAVEDRVVVVAHASCHNTLVSVGAAAASSSVASRIYRNAAATPMPNPAASRA